MINDDKKQEFDRTLSVIEYVASFWNPEAVKKIQESRKANSKHNFKNDKEFEKEIIDGKYKENPLLEHIINSRKIEQERKTKSDLAAKKSSKTKLPTDLSVIHSTLESLNGRRK
jgi:hypothetical protein